MKSFDSILTEMTAQMHAILDAPTPAPTPPLGDLIRAFYDADDAFYAAIKAAGYKSRWDWNQAQDSRPMAAYVAKVLADEAMHAGFEAIRKT